MVYSAVFVVAYRPRGSTMDDELMTWLRRGDIPTLSLRVSVWSCIGTTWNDC
jgi:hypothetical protein